MSNTRIVICNNAVIGISRNEDPLPPRHGNHPTIPETGSFDHLPFLDLSNSGNADNALKPVSESRTEISDKTTQNCHDLIRESKNTLMENDSNFSLTSLVRMDQERHKLHVESTADVEEPQKSRVPVHNKPMLSQHQSEPTLPRDNLSFVPQMNDSESTIKTLEVISEQNVQLQPPVTFRVVSDQFIDIIAVKPTECSTSEDQQYPNAGLEETHILTQHQSAEIPQDVSKQKKNERFQCDLCSTTCSTITNLERHKMVHTVYKEDSYRYRCEKCGKQFLQNCDLKRHSLVHTNDYPHRCSICNKGYLRENDLKRHVKFHLKERNHNCPHCDKSFVQKGDLQRHVKYVHLKVAKLVCGHCNRKYGSESTLTRHMQTAHLDVLLKTSDEIHENEHRG